jgi:hypothetical protein
MKQKKMSKSAKKDKRLQRKIEEKIVTEKLALNHPRGKERFQQVIRNAIKKH